jgi:mannose/fructose/N-acetylgalactosamine-specific phosphotransferase system component IIC
MYTGLSYFMCNIGQVIGLAVPAASTLAVVAFFYGIAKFIFNADDEKKRAEGKSILTWSIAAMFVLVTIYGIIAFMQETVGNDQVVKGDMDIIVPGVYVGG